MTYNELQKSLYKTTSAEVERAATELAKVWGEASKKSREELRKLYIKLQGLPQSELYNGAIKFQRLSKLIQLIEDEQRKAWTIAGQTIRRTGELAFTNQFHRSQYSILLGAADSMRSTFALLDPSVVEAAVLGIPGQWSNLAKTYGAISNYVPKYGTLTSVLLDNRTKSARAIQGAITNGLIQGQGYQQTARDLRRAFETTANNALRIIRTETHRLQNGANTAASQWAQSQGAEIVRLWQATLDDRTRDSHAQLDGVPENKDGGWIIDGEFAPYPGAFASASQSVNCRCAIVDQVQGMEPTTRRARDPATGKTELIQAKNFQTWASENGLKKNRFGRYYSVGK